jgi:hypothetical protein
VAFRTWVSRVHAICVCVCVCMCVCVCVCECGRFGFVGGFFGFIGLDTWIRGLNGPGAPFTRSLGFNSSALACASVGGSEGWARDVRLFVFICVCFYVSEESRCGRGNKR